MAEESNEQKVVYSTGTGEPMTWLPSSKQKEEQEEE
tara:strand:+ start:259 stop:366 length:108 start_codon:yes stop_codon:yes gene_type:complete